MDLGSMNDPQVYLQQLALQTLGFDPGPLDGIEGKKTRSARDAWIDSLIGIPAAIEGRKVNSAGLELIKHFEGLYLSAYKDPVGIWTIGYGHTGLKHRDGTVKAGRKVTQKEADQLLNYDLATFAKRVIEYVKVPLNDNEFSALVSFDFNTGGLPSSTLLKKLNAGDRKGASQEFLRWVYAGGKVLKGLERRRKSEQNLFLGRMPYIVKS